MSQVMTSRARVAALSRSRTIDDPEFVAARQDHAANMVAAYVEKVLASAPPLTDEQAARIAGLLRPTAGGAR